MSIRAKIMLMASGILLIFALTLGLWALLAKEVKEELAAEIVAELDVITFEYELILHRPSRHPESRAALAAATHRSREIVARLRQSIH